ncbi:tetratricopeptide repeat protein [Rhodovarius crocodyli]|uniref:Tetratricopeptide repeat protein n=1 Tax=Rhodovarius crocodyli TaxID=1979269 RepID=A0A437LZ49_9PROT|nr:tetratricopeptide repeat protein [Rhodovarius crocodyli]RVT90584.1 tetratricopeptide repeat protein [Rhodovarius crocodyli]
MGVDWIVENMTTAAANDPAKLQVNAGAEGDIVLSLPNPAGAGLVDIKVTQQVPVLMRLVSSVYLDGGYPEAALDWGRRMVASAPFEPGSYIHLSNVYTRLGRSADAEQVLAQGIDKLPRAAGILRQRSSLALRQGDLQQALTWAQRAVEMAPQEPVMQLSLANVQMQLGDFEAAQEIVNRVLGDQPTLPAALRVRSLISLRTAELEDALDAAVMAAKVAPEDVGMRVNLVNVHLQLGDADQARTVALEALNDHPTSAFLMRLLSIAYQRGADFEPALEWAGKALDAAPHEPVMYANLASIYLQFGDIDQAKAQLQAGISEHPGFVPLMRLLANAHQREGDIEGALSWALKAQDAAPADAGIRNLVAVLSKKAGKAA